MKQSILKDIVCPISIGGTSCHGRLALAEDVAPFVTMLNNATEVTEGLLRCEHCGAEYPILCGLAVLAPDTLTYLRTNYGLILGLAAEQGITISRPMLDYLQRRGAHVAARDGSSGWNYSSTHTHSLYLCAHYDNVLDILPVDHPLRGLLQAYYGHDLYTVLMEMLVPYLEPAQRVLDIGCNVGRMSRELAAHCETVYGVDLAFGAAFTARRILTGWPSSLTNYELFSNGLTRQLRSLNLPPFPNAEVMIASGTCLPFMDAAFDVVNSSNVIDVVSDPAELVTEKERVLKQGGLFVMTDPYCWEIAAPVEKWLGGKEPLPSAEAVRQQLGRMMNILAEVDNAPWVLRDHDRKFSIYLNHCVVGRKSHP